MRAFIFVVIGAVVGFVLGFLAPIVLVLLMSWIDPVGMKPEDQAPYMFFIIFAAPAGVYAGGKYGLYLSNPKRKVVKWGMRAVLDDFEQQFHDSSIEEQRLALIAILPKVISDYRKTVLFSLSAMFVLFLGFRTPLVPILMVANVAWCVWTIVDMRSGIKTIRNRWGDEVIDQLGPLPYSLRS